MLMTLSLIVTTAVGLQRQLGVLHQVYHERQFSDNLAKTKVVAWGSKATCSDNKVEQVESYKYLWIAFHETQNLVVVLALLLGTNPGL